MTEQRQDPKRIMRVIDALPPDYRRVVHEYGTATLEFTGSSAPASLIEKVMRERRQQKQREMMRS